ncbi:MAG: 30S ribosomal protein S12 methylthiotransferase RimO [Verrucomicrobia bacterium]|nr:30S ribosomal protein S12 methylthiotransferase RimO [Verrucomicrobiota bacterium]
MTDDASVPISVGFISLGCAKNLVDSQTMAGNLVTANITLAAAPEDADVVIVNTCSFVEDAREESMEMILSACQLKQDGACRAVLVAGCLPQRYREQIQEALPDVDAFIGVDELDRVPEIVRELEAGKRHILEVSEQAERLFEPVVPVVFSGGANAYLKIAEGCNHQCAFCAIPGIRGRHRSRSLDQVVGEAESLLGQGFRELDIISQDIMSYGRDRQDDTSLPALLRRLGTLGGDFWVRLLYGYPSLVSDELLEVMAETPQVCHYLDVPIQHSHPDVLKGMRRGSTVPHVKKMVDRVRSVMPDATLRTTCLVGFPGETEEHFEHLLEFCQSVRFDHLGAFVYSPEENTPAYEMDAVPPLEVAEARYARLMEQQKTIVDENNKALLGETIDVLLETVEDDACNTWRGRSLRQAPEVDGTTFVEDVPDELGLGDFVSATYTATYDYDMRAVYTQEQ